MYTKTTTSRRQQQGLPVTDRAGRAIGRLIGRQYHKLITRPDQILRSPPGFGFDVWAMDFYVLPRVDELVVEDKVNARIYRCSAQTFQQHRIQINRGAGPQYVLPLGYWAGEDQGLPSRRVIKVTEAPPQPVAMPEGQARML